MLRVVKLGILIFLVLAPGSVAQTSRSIAEGVYTAEQANRGKTAYVEHCARCHGNELGGGDETPALVGDKFLGNWRNHSVNELFERVRVSMPADRPGSLGRQMLSDILAYMFAVNQFPAGGQELSIQGEALKQIQFQAAGGPGRQSQGTPNGAAATVTSPRSISNAAPGPALSRVDAGRPAVLRESR